MYWNHRDELSWDLKQCPACPYFGLSAIRDFTILTLSGL